MFVTLKVQSGWGSAPDPACWGRRVPPRHHFHPHLNPGSALVGRGPPFAYWRKVGLQAYTKICSGVLCNIVVNIVMLLHIRVVISERLDYVAIMRFVCLQSSCLKICTCIASGCGCR